MRALVYLTPACLVVIVGCSAPLASPDDNAPKEEAVAPSKAEALYTQAVAARRREDLDAAIDLAEKALVEDPELVMCRVRLTEWLQEKGFPLSKSKRWDEAAPLFLRSAKLARTLKGQKDPFTDIPGILVTSVYNEACAYSMTGEKEKALASLEEALELGFLDREFAQPPSPKELFLSDPDLDSLREEKRFEELRAKYLPE